MIRHMKTAVLALIGVFVSAGCTQIDVNDLPTPGRSFPGGYPVVMEFESVLNLPAGAKVTMDGLQIGIVTGVAIAGRHVDVTARIAPEVSIPADAHVVLQQATVLGDIYVAVQRGTEQSSTRTLNPGGKVPLSQTTSPPQLEDTLANLATFVGAGSIQQMQTAIIGINRITPSPPEIRKIASRFAADINDLSNNIEVVNHLLESASQTAAVLQYRKAEIGKVLSPSGKLGWTNAIGIYQYVSTAFPSLGSIYSGGFWLAPLLNSLANATEALRASKWAFESEVPKWRDLFTDYFLPTDRYPAVNITSIVGPDGRELSADVHDVLRLLGAMP